MTLVRIADDHWVDPTSVVRLRTVESCSCRPHWDVTAAVVRHRRFPRRRSTIITPKTVTLDHHEVYVRTGFYYDLVDTVGRYDDGPFRTVTMHEFHAPFPDDTSIRSGDADPRAELWYAAIRADHRATVERVAAEIVAVINGAGGRIPDVTA